MKKPMRVFIAVIMCLGFVVGFLGCETDEAGSPSAETEKIAPRAEETGSGKIPPKPEGAGSPSAETEKVIPQGKETMPPGEEALPAPEERQPQGKRKGGDDVP